MRKIAKAKSACCIMNRGASFEARFSMCSHHYEIDKKKSAATEKNDESLCAYFASSSKYTNGTL